MSTMKGTSGSAHGAEFMLPRTSHQAPAFHGKNPWDHFTPCSFNNKQWLLEKMTLTEKGFPRFTVFPVATRSTLHSGGEGVPTWNNLNTVVHWGTQDKANSSLFSFSFLIHMLVHITKLAVHSITYTGFWEIDSQSLEDWPQHRPQSLPLNNCVQCIRKARETLDVCFSLKSMTPPHYL